MDFKKTKTYENLAKSFAGECMAGMRYQFTALLAEQQGYIILSNKIREIAKNETKHAKVFFDYIIAHGNEDITFCGDFPFKGDTLKKDSYPCARSSDMSWTWPKNAHAYPLPQAPPAAQLCPEAEAYSICIQVAGNPPLHHSQSGQPSCAHALRYQYGQHQPLPLVCEAEWT